MKRLNIEDMHKIAAAHNGKCLSDMYRNSRTKLLWECAEGHKWQATPGSIKNGRWCPYCGGSVKKTIEDIQQLAEKRSGKCLSTTYINTKTKLLWQCSEGHQWQATPGSIKNGRWCPYCGGSVKKTIEDMQQLAEKRSGKCLSTTYIDTKTKLLWQCSEGHQWEAAPGNIKTGHWCPYCARLAKGTIEEMRNIAQKRGGKCLSKNYVDIKTKLLWECAEGHQWEATPSSIKRGSWCRTCASKDYGEKRKLGIDQMRNLANKYGGECLSDTYVNNSTKLLWRCAQGHEWKTTPKSVSKGFWCPHCSGMAKGSIEDMYRIAKERGGRCLSQSYINNKTKLLWQCDKGHQWEAKPNQITKGQWCPYCAGKVKGTIEEMQIIAKERGGQCLSEIYHNKDTKVLWQCAEGHQWEATPNSVKRGSWCPECSSGLGERICREFFEQLFQRKFPKCYPKWLKSLKGGQMELDGYCKPLRIAFEHHGEQHYSTKTHFITAKEELQKRQDMDRMKRQLCAQRGILLIEVPEIPTRLAVGSVRRFIRKKCERHGLSLPDDFETREISLHNAYLTPSSRQILKELQAIAEERGGRCLSKTYINNTTDLLWECAEGHQWWAQPTNIKSGRRTWCPYCAGKAKSTIEEMQVVAQSHGGRCLSENYINTDTPLLWQCAEGHQWEARPHGIKKGHWCPYCAGNVKDTIEEMNSIAQKRGGKCLSKSYTNNSTHLVWQCANNHQWSATPNSVKMGSWCPYCAGVVRGTIEEMQILAKERGGKCLSTTYGNAHTKLLWECAEGHQWETAPHGIKKGNWCPYCAGKAKGTIEEMRAIAQKRGGMCLSSNYVNSSTKLLWQCAKGHQWQAAPSSIKSGRWCPRCSGKVKRTLEDMQRLAEERGGKCLSNVYTNAHTKLLWQCAEGHQWEAKPNSINNGHWCPYCARNKLYKVL